jgi:hypothetical protein
MCFQEPEKWNHKAVALAGSEVTFEEATKIFKEKTGLDAMPETYEFLSRGLLWAVSDVDKMFTWFASDGYGANVAELKKIYPGMLSLGEYLEQESGWKTK